MGRGSTISLSDRSISELNTETEDALARAVKVRGVAMTLCYLALCTCEHSQLLREHRYRVLQAPGEHRSN